MCGLQNKGDNTNRKGNMTMKNITDSIKQIPQKLLIAIAENTFYEFNNLRNQPEMCYYTDMATFLNGIVVNKPEPNKEICLWASRYSYLNDEEELRNGLERLKIMGAPDYLVNGLSQMHSKDHIISLSMAKDSLPMWNTYGDKGNGVMLLFDTKRLLSIYAGRLQPCFYSNSQYDNNIEDTISYTKYGQNYWEMSKEQQIYVNIFLASMYVILRKNVKYNYEKEVRIFGIGSEYFDETKEIHYRYAKGKVVPYVMEYLPKDALKGVCVGPTAEFDLSSNALNEFLLSKGFGHCNIIKSEIPFRG